MSETPAEQRAEDTMEMPLELSAAYDHLIDADEGPKSLGMHRAG